jgi:hypothetical protein
VHGGNYSDLPLFDILLGTWNNPRDFAPEQGFHPGASSEYAAMLLGRDVASRADAGLSAPSRATIPGESR